MIKENNKNTEKKREKATCTCIFMQGAWNSNSPEKYRPLLMTLKVSTRKGFLY
jgi:hypothetical protein